MLKIDDPRVFVKNFAGFVWPVDSGCLPAVTFASGTTMAAGGE
jgi:hypothetical protein